MSCQFAYFQHLECKRINITNYLLKKAGRMAYRLLVLCVYFFLFCKVEIAK